jgi:hypothetical protein
MAAAPPPPRRLIRQNAVVLNHGNFPEVPIQPLVRQEALGIPNNVVPVTTPKPISQRPRNNLPRTGKERKQRGSRRRRMSTRRRAY